MTTDLYAGAGTRWASGASLVYGPIAEQLVAMCPCPLSDRTVADVGAGTGVATPPLKGRGAHVLAFDLSPDMLVLNTAPGAAADIESLPVRDGAVDVVVAAFVLNHLPDPTYAFGELIRVAQPDGVLLVCVYSASNRSAARDRIDAVAVDEGWVVPDWYVEIKTRAVPVLGDAGRMEAAALEAGLVAVEVDERPVDVGVTEPEQLVDYRLGQAHFTSWLAAAGPDVARKVRARAVAAVRPLMEPYRPGVVFMSARTRR